MLNAQKNIRTQAMPCSMYFFANLLRQRSSPCPHITTTELKMYDERSPSYELLYPRVLVTDTNAHGSHVLLFGRAPQLAPLDARMTTARPMVFRLCAAVESFACLPFPAAHQDALDARALLDCNLSACFTVALVRPERRKWAMMPERPLM